MQAKAWKVFKLHIYFVHTTNTATMENRGHYFVQYLWTQVEYTLLIDYGNLGE